MMMRLHIIIVILKDGRILWPFFIEYVVNHISQKSESLVHKFESDIEKLKGSGISKLPAELMQAGRKTLSSQSHKFLIVL